MAGRGFTITLIIIFSIVLTLTIITDFFTLWTFFGMLFMGLMYLFGYLYVVNYYLNKIKTDQNDAANRKKFDWCWNRVNEQLRKMPGGQGLEWARGRGRQSEYRTYYDGIQHKPFRSMLGFLAETQQLVVIIYDIDGDDIVKFQADPDPEVIENHFYGFKPFQQRTMDSGIGTSGYDRYGRRIPYNNYRSGRGVSIHVGGDDNAEGDFDAIPSKTPISDDVADDAFKRLRRND